jgi:hypothetical protein
VLNISIGATMREALDEITGTNPFTKSLRTIDTLTFNNLISNSLHSKQLPQPFPHHQLYNREWAHSNPLG